jgi:hypothetical protein
MDQLTNRQQKIFKRVITEFFREYILITNIKIKIPSISKSNILNFVDQVKENFDEYSKCSGTILSQIDLLSQIDPSKVKIQWRTLHSLFLIALIETPEFTKPQIIEKFRVGLTAPIQQTQQIQQQIQPTNAFNMNPDLITQMMPMVMGMMGGNGSNPLLNTGGVMGDLIKQTSDELMKSLEGKEDQLKDINPMELFSSLMSGNKNVAGIDLNNVINNLQSSIKNKIDTKELDPSTLKEQLSNVLPEEFKDKVSYLK